MNILDSRFDTPYNTAPFSKIKTDAFLPSFVKAIETAKKEIDQIVQIKKYSLMSIVFKQVVL